MCALAGIEAAALTDHNTVGNCAAFCEAAKRYGILALPGMELTTAEEVHVVCVFGNLDAAQAFEAEVFRRLPPLENDPRVFGPQVKMDSEDTVLGEERRMLATATGIGIYEVPGLVASLGGACWPAHIDRPSFSLISNLGLWDPDLGFSFAEVSRSCPPDFLDRPDLKGLPVITASDAHYLDQVIDACQKVSLPEKNFSSLLAWLKRPDFNAYSLLQS
ncbi:PHP domain [uncultured Flavonifractor sp.]|nr:PHP domain [uncultured Flavonifractor sp.]